MRALEWRVLRFKIELSDGPGVGRRPGDSKLLCFLASSCGEPQNRIKFLEC
jgi:hypothetical protein